MNQLADLILREQFLRSVSTDLETYLKERNLKSFADVVASAEAYRSAHLDFNLAASTSNATWTMSATVVPPNRGGFCNRFVRRQSSVSRDRNRQDYNVNKTLRSNVNQSKFQNRFCSENSTSNRSVICFRCNKGGHMQKIGKLYIVVSVIVVILVVVKFLVSFLVQLLLHIVKILGHLEYQIIFLAHLSK